MSKTMKKLKHKCVTMLMVTWHHMRWPIEILRIYLVQQALKKYYMIKKFNVVINPKKDGYQRALHQWFLEFLIKKFSCGVIKKKVL